MPPKTESKSKTTKSSKTKNDENKKTTKTPKTTKITKITKTPKTTKTTKSDKPRKTKKEEPSSIIQNIEIIEDEPHESDYRQIMLDYNVSKNKSPPILTDYEIPLMIGKRATQIAYGARPLITVKPGMNHIDIAEEELRQKKIPFMVKRYVGNNPEYWRIEDLEVNF